MDEFKSLLRHTIENIEEKKNLQRKEINRKIEKIIHEIYEKIPLKTIKRSKLIKIILEILENNKI